MSDSFAVAGKRILVTGSKGYLGRYLVNMLLGQGAVVLGTDRAPEDAGDTGFFQCDVADAAGVLLVVEKAAARMGGLDSLINCAGYARLFPAESLPDDAWDETLKASLYGSFHFARAAFPYLKDSRGSIVNVASIAGLIGLPRGTTHHSAAKAGMLGMTRSLAVEWAKYGIRVNGIAPGQFETAQLLQIMANPDNARAILGNIPLGRIGTCREISLAIQFLISDAASFVTGHTLVVDGGSTIM